MIHFEDEALLDYSWIETEKLEFKLLVMSSVLAMEKKAFLGTMADITDYLGIANNRSNHAKINTALSKLTRQGYVKVFRDKANYIISLSYDAKSNSKVISIQRAWIDIIREYKPSVSVAWETILRVFLYLLGNNSKEVISYKMIASDLKLHENTVSNAIKALCNIDFGNLIVEKKAVFNNKQINGITFFHCLGTNFSIMTNFQDVRTVAS